MEFDQILQIADRCGVFVFSLSGAIVAVRARMDLFGILVLSLLPAVGGGTLRDIMLDAPIFWLEDGWSILLALSGGLATYFLYSVIEGFRPLRWADALGLALFAATGAAKTHALGFEPHVVIIMSVMTATFGGVARDIVANQVPLLFREEIYAAAALAGGATYWVLSTATSLDPNLSVCFSASVVLLIRTLAIVFEWELPKPR